MGEQLGGRGSSGGIEAEADGQEAVELRGPGVRILELGRGRGGDDEQGAKRLLLHV